MTVVANVFSNVFTITGFSNTADTLKITNANTYLSANDLVRYVVPTDNTAIEGLESNTSYYISFANSTDVALSETKGGANVDITETSYSESHQLYLNTPLIGVMVTNNFLVTLEGSNLVSIDTLKMNSLPTFFCRGYAMVEAGSGPGDVGETYSQSGTTVTVTSNNHGLRANDTIYAMFLSGTATNNFFTIATVPTTNTYTFTRSSATTSGSYITYYNYIANTPGNIRLISSNANGTYVVHFDTGMTNNNYFIDVKSYGSGQSNSIISIDVESISNTKFTVKTYANSVARAVNGLMISVFK